MKSIIETLLALSLVVGSTKAIDGGGTPESIARPGEEFPFKTPTRIFGRDYSTSDQFYVSINRGRIWFGRSNEPGSFVAGEGIIDNSVLMGFNLDNDPTTSGQTFNYMELTNKNPLQNLVRENFIDAKEFVATGGFIVKGVSRYTSITGGNMNAAYEMAVVTSGAKTYAIFQYTTVNTKENLEQPEGNQIKTFAGFGLENTKEIAMLPYVLKEMDLLQNASGLQGGVESNKGMYIYQIDSWPPVRGGCLSHMPTEVANRRLSSSLTEDTILGGSTVIVSSICHSKAIGEQAGECILKMDNFEIDRTPAIVCKNCNKAYLACNIPTSLREGPASLELTLSHVAAPFSADINIVHPNAITSEEAKVKPNADELLYWDDLVPKVPGGRLTVTWSSAELMGNEKLEIIGYSEEDFPSAGTSTKDTVAKVTKIMFTANVTGNTGTYHFEVGKTSCTNSADCGKYHMGFLRITDSNTPPTIFNSHILPLGWFVNPTQRPNWADGRCQRITELTGADINQEISKQGCPLSETEARYDSSRIVYTNKCPRIPGSDCSKAHPAQNCYLSTPTSKELDALPASSCCYDQSNGKLLFQEDLEHIGRATEGEKEWHASSSLKSHPIGVSGTNLRKGQITYLSHWYWDIMYFYYCCRWTSQESHPRICPFNYMKNRPTPKQSNYKNGRIGYAVGDPHVASFSGASYLLNAKGEYWLLRTDFISIQGRLELIPNKKNATFFTAVAFQITSTGERYTIKINKGADRDTVPFLVMHKMAKQNAKKLIITPSKPWITSSVTIVARNITEWVVNINTNGENVGLNLLAYPKQGYMDMIVAIADNMQDKTQGLMGNWNPNKQFVIAITGTAINYNNNDKEFQAKFVSENKITKNTDSVFEYDSIHEQGSINSEDGYHPAFEAANSDASIAACGSENKACNFDYVIIGAEVAALTKVSSTTYDVAQNISKSERTFCDRPFIPGLMLAKDGKTPSLEEGASISLNTCVRNTQIKNSKTVTCTKNTDNTYSWVPDTAGTACEPLAGPEDFGQAGLSTTAIILIVVGCVVLLVVIIIAGVLVSRRQGPPSDTELADGKQQHNVGDKNQAAETKPFLPVPAPRPSGRTPPTNSNSRENIVRQPGMDRGGYENQARQQTLKVEDDLPEVEIENGRDPHNRPTSYAVAQGQPMTMYTDNEQEYKPRPAHNVSASADV